MRVENDFSFSFLFWADEASQVTVRDIFFAGMDTTSGALEYAMLYLVLKPEVHFKLQEEVHEVIGRQRRPDFTDTDR